MKYDEVWVLYDLEGAHSERRAQCRAARGKAAASGVRVAESDPCFEYWIALHFEETTAGSNSCSDYTSRVNRHIPGYDKNYSFSAEDLDRRAKASERAKRCRQHHLASRPGRRGDREAELSAGELGNPCTDVDKLVDVLDGVARALHEGSSG